VGVSSALTINQTGAIKAFTLSVDIQHPFIGDLQISVLAPDGAAFLLRSPSSDSSQNLITSYTSADTAALAQVLGKQAQGIWTLKVADMARLGVGTLRTWSLEMGLSVTPLVAKQIHAENSPNLPIPDKDPAGITSTMAIGANGEVAALTVFVDIVHEFVGDLQITLTSPAGSAVTLLSPSTDPGQNLTRSFAPADTLALSGLLGQQAHGNWSLGIADLVRLSVGRLRKWSMDIILR
jgi:subtilisin-like proprotein convertase family protein